MIITTSSSVTNLNYHLVWVTKYRKQILNEKVRQRLKQYIEQICQDKECKIKAMEIMPDHVHILIQMPPKISVTAMIKFLKGTTAKWLFRDFPEIKQSLWKNHLWSPSYFASSIGDCSQETIVNYINNQWKK